MDLEVDVSFKEASFRIPGPLIVHIEFKNGSSKPIALNTAFNVFGDCDLKFHIVTPSGDAPTQALILQGRRPSSYTARDFRKVPTGGKYEVEIDLAKWFQLNEEGIYKVEIEYSNRQAGQQLGINVWTGRIKSPTRTFQLTRSR